MAASPTTAFPLIDIPEGAELDSFTPPLDISRSLVHGLQNSGFLLVTTPLIPADLQAQALQAATTFLESDSPLVVAHPTDPKSYCMLDFDSAREVFTDSSPGVLVQYFAAMEKVKIAVLRCIAVGLDLEPSYFSRLHDENNSSLRLLRYPAASESTGNRCKEHSDYGTVTLLSTDGVSGLEAFHKNEWLPVPYVKGALVVNIGSLLSDWTGGSLVSTLHRVAGPSSKESQSPIESLSAAVRKPRTSMAFFADPNKEVKARISKACTSSSTTAQEEEEEAMSVAEYVKWRSGGSDANCVGVAFTEVEWARVKGSDDANI